MTGLSFLLTYLKILLTTNICDLHLQNVIHIDLLTIPMKTNLLVYISICCYLVIAALLVITIVIFLNDIFDIICFIVDIYLSKGEHLYKII